MAAKQIQIGPEFFAKAKNDYEDWHWAIIREFLQNSIDCNSSRIGVHVETRGEDTVLIVANDGDTMTNDVLEDKLLCLGGSGKNFADGSVGGFGKAKEILYFCHKSYKIESGNLLVVGSGAGYDLSESELYYHGTRSEIVIGGTHTHELSRAVKIFAKYAQWNGSLLLNGDSLECNHNKGSRRRDLGFGVIYTNKSESNVCVVRIGGIPMFKQYCGYDRLVIVELTGKSDALLTSNRDGLVSPYRGELSSFITELSVDKKSALRPQVPKYEHFGGEKLSHHSHAATNMRGLVAIVGESAEGSTEGSTEGSDIIDGVIIDGIGQIGFGKESEPSGISVVTRPSGNHMRAAAYSSVQEEHRVATLGNEFIIKNETDLVVPNYYRPDSEEFSSYSRRLIKIWGRLMLELHRTFDHGAEFGVGFIFDEHAEAEHESGVYRRVYYISPAVIVEQRHTYSKSFKKTLEVR